MASHPSETVSISRKGLVLLSIGMNAFAGHGYRTEEAVRDRLQDQRCFIVAAFEIVLDRRFSFSTRAFRIMGHLRQRRRTCSPDPHVMPVPRRSPHSISHPGLRRVSRIQGRTHVSTRPRAAPIQKILLAPKWASTHVAKFWRPRLVRHSGRLCRLRCRRWPMILNALPQSSHKAQLWNPILRIREGLGAGFGSP
jgi:hypothetical protein